MKMEMHQPTLIVVCGWPLSGKTTVATAISRRLGIHHIDIDDVRCVMIGLPHPHPEESPELMKRDEQEMAMAYRLLIAGADENLAAGRSLIITATFSRKTGQQMILNLMAKHPGAQLKVIQCVPQGDTPEVVAKMLAECRKFGSKYKGTVNSPERYFEVKARYAPIELPHLKLSTWGSENSIDDELRIAADYILSPQANNLDNAV